MDRRASLDSSLGSSIIILINLACHLANGALSTSIGAPPHSRVAVAEFTLIYYMSKWI